MSKEVKPLLPDNPTPEDLRNIAQIIDYLLPECKKRGMNKKAQELEAARELYLLTVEIMDEKGYKTLDEMRQRSHKPFPLNPNPDDK